MDEANASGADHHQPSVRCGAMAQGKGCRPTMAART